MGIECNKMNFFSSKISDRSKEYVKQVLDSGMLSEGEWTDRFEKEFKSKFSIKYGFSVNSGTSALHLALLLAGVKQGDEVITSPQTFIATGMAILMCGAIPIFCDINLDGTLDSNCVENFITDKTKAILTVNWGGYISDLNKLKKICDTFDLQLIQDSAHALGGVFEKNFIDDFGFNIYSFQSIKHLTTGDGGWVTVPDYKTEEEGKRLRWFGIDRAHSKIEFLGEREYNIDRIGYKYHMNNVAAAIGLGNLEDYTDERRQYIASLYNFYLRDVKGLQLMPYVRPSVYWLYPILIENRGRFIKKMMNNKIPVSIVHKGIDNYKLFGGQNIYDKKPLKNQRYWDAHQIHLPIHDEITDDDVYKITKCIKDGW